MMSIVLSVGRLDARHMANNWKIEIIEGNAGVETKEQIADLLLSVSGRIRAGEEAGNMLDINGNYAGYFERQFNFDPES
jgi:hypothetical protein